MPLYDWECINCGGVFEAYSTMADSDCPHDCPTCLGVAERKFTPTRNLLIPASFKRDANWHMPNGERSDDSAPFSDSNSVHTPKRTSFREKFEENWR